MFFRCSLAFSRPKRTRRWVMHASLAHVGDVTWRARHRTRARWRPEQKAIKPSQKHPNPRHDDADARSAREKNTSARERNRSARERNRSIYSLQVAIIIQIVSVQRRVCVCTGPRDRGHFLERTHSTEYARVHGAVCAECLRSRGARPWWPTEDGVCSQRGRYDEKRETER